LIKKENENEVKAMLNEILKQAKPAESAPAPQTALPNQPLPGLRSSTPPNPKEQAMINQLMGMGYSATQAREAVWATGSAGVEQALDFLLRG